MAHRCPHDFLQLNAFGNCADCGHLHDRKCRQVRAVKLSIRDAEATRPRCRKCGQPGVYGEGLCYPCYRRS